MPDLFPSTVPRPRTLTREAALAAAGRVVDSLIRVRKLEARDRDGSIADIVASYTSVHMNGYELAKRLDNHHGWTIDSDMVAELDGWWDAAREELQALEGAWFAAHPRDPLPIGTRVGIRMGRALRESGTITGIDRHYVARYEVKADGDPDPTRRLIVLFEDAEPLAEAVPA